MRWLAKAALTRAQQRTSDGGREGGREEEGRGAGGGGTQAGRQAGRQRQAGRLISAAGQGTACRLPLPRAATPGALLQLLHLFLSPGEPLLILSLRCSHRPPEDLWQGMASQGCS